MKIKIEVSALADLKKDLRRAEEMVDYLTEHLRAYADAAEFEARVAAKLAGGRPWWGCSTRCPWNRMDMQDTLACRFERLGQKFCALRDARLAVEEEMEYDV